MVLWKKKKRNLDSVISRVGPKNIHFWSSWVLLLLPLYKPHTMSSSVLELRFRANCMLTKDWETVIHEERKLAAPGPNLASKCILYDLHTVCFWHLEWQCLRIEIWGFFWKTGRTLLQILGLCSHVIRTEDRIYVLKAATETISFSMW